MAIIFVGFRAGEERPATHFVKLAELREKTLLLKALDLIYKDKVIKTWPYEHFALYIDIDDWYWVACSALAPPVSCWRAPPMVKP